MHLESTKEPNTVRFYKTCAANLLRWPDLADSALTKITAETITAFIEHRKEANLEPTTINRDLATLRRALRLAHEWGALPTAPPKIRLLDGENCRERVLTPREESAYLKAARPLLRDFAVIMLECGLRPDGGYRLKWRENYKDGRIVIHKGKTKAARRAIPVTDRLAALLKVRQKETGSEGWIFPAPTKSGHINQSSLKKAHYRALKDSAVTPFVIYDLRHTCLTRWAKYMDPFTLKKLAGHESLETTMKYIHLNETQSEDRLAEVRRKLREDLEQEVYEWNAREWPSNDGGEAQAGHSMGHSEKQKAHQSTRSSHK